MCETESVNSGTEIVKWVGKFLKPHLVKVLEPIVSRIAAKVGEDTNRHKRFQELYFKQVESDMEKGTLRVYEERTPEGGITYAVKAVQEAADETPPDVEVHPVGERFSEQWVEGVYSVDDEGMARIWANLLSGEMRNPGSSSLHTMSLLKRLSPSEARWINELLATQYIGNAVWHLPDSIFVARSLDPFIPQLKNIGVLEPNDQRYELVHRELPTGAIKSTTLLSCNTVVLKVSSNEQSPSSTLEVVCTPLTLQGLDLCRLSRAKTDPDFLQAVQYMIQDKGFDVEVVPKSEVFSPPSQKQPGSLMDKQWL